MRNYFIVFCFLVLIEITFLQLHLINLTGLMSKQSLAARVSLADEIMPKILDSAEKPLTVNNVLIFSNMYCIFSR